MSDADPSVSPMPIERFYVLASCAGAVGALATVVLLIWMPCECCKWSCEAQKIAKLIIALSWSLLPPAWFAVENQFMRRHVQQGHATPDWLECHKLNQDTAKSIWAGISVLILLLLQGF